MLRLIDQKGGLFCQRPFAIIATAASLAMAGCFPSLAESPAEISEGGGHVVDRAGSEGGVLKTDAPLTLAMNLNVTQWADIFSQVQTFLPERSVVGLRDSRYATWTYNVGADSGGVLHPVSLKAVRVGSDLEAIGVLTPIPSGATAIELPENVPCDPIEIQSVSLARADFQFLASCRVETPSSKTEFVLFNADGQHRTLGDHPQRVARFNVTRPFHSGSLALSLLTEADLGGAIYLQQYLWAP